MAQVMLITFISFVVGGVAQGCDTSDLNKEKYAYSIATGKNTFEAKRKALDEYFLGKDRKAAAAIYNVSEQAKVGSHIDAEYQKTIHTATSLWIEDFVTRSCKHENGYKVAVIFPKKGIHYYDKIPKEITIGLLRSMDKGYGVAVDHFVGSFKIEIVNPNVKCFGKTPSRYCVYPYMPRWNVRTKMIKNYTFKFYHEVKRRSVFRSRPGRIDVMKFVSNNPKYSDPKDLNTEKFLLELASRDGSL